MTSFPNFSGSFGGDDASWDGFPETSQTPSPPQAPIGSGNGDDREDREDPESSFADYADLNFSNFHELEEIDANSVYWKALFLGLLQFFGHKNFRKGQLEALMALSQNHDLLATLPTGLGKSLIYQLFAASSKKGVCLTIVPVRSIMAQQVLNEAGRGVYLERDWKEHTTDILRGKYKVLYFAPEWLVQEASNNFDQLKLDFLRDIESQIGVNLITFDESHLLLTWSSNLSDFIFSLHTAGLTLVVVPFHRHFPPSFRRNASSQNRSGDRSAYFDAQWQSRP